MEAHTQAAVADAINAACHAAKAGVRLYNAVCEAPGVLDARQRRGLFGLGKHLAGDPTAADHDCIAVDLMLNFIGNSAMSSDDRMNLVNHLTQEAVARSAPQPCRPLASTDDIALCLALDAAAFIRTNIGLALGAAHVDLEFELAQRRDTDGRGIAIPLLLNAHIPVGLALGATRIALRVGLDPRTQGAYLGRQLCCEYDAALAALDSDTQHMMASIRADIESPTPDPELASPGSYLAKEFANIVHNVTMVVGSAHASIAENASAVAHLAAKTAEANDTALKAILT